MENKKHRIKRQEIVKMNKFKCTNAINPDASLNSDASNIKMVELKIADNITALQRILQIFSRRAYKIESMEVKSDGDVKIVRIRFPADVYSYKTVVEQLKKLIDLIGIKHDEVSDTNFEDKLIENLF